MSTQDPPAPSTVSADADFSAAATRHPPAPRADPAPRARGGGTAAFALLVALAAAAAAGYGWWQSRAAAEDDAGAARELAALQARVAELDSGLDALRRAQAGLDQRLGDGAQVNRALREELLGQGERTRHVEDALARLAASSLSGRDGMLLDDAESLLRMGAERYRLFRDAAGAAAAYALADQALAQQGSSAFAGVRQSIDAEREALQRAAVDGDGATLEALGRLRGALADLPARPAAAPASAPAAGFGARLANALGGIVRVERDAGAPLAAETPLARELLGLDLAEAQAAWLARDAAGWDAALARADAALATHFDPAAAAVKAARAQLAALRPRLAATPAVQLGAALEELRNLRSVRSLAPVAPAPAAAAPGDQP